MFFDLTETDFCCCFSILPAAVLSISPSSSVQEGEAVTMTCDVPGEDKQEIHYSWYKNNIWIKEGAAQSLVFQEVAVGDTGYYSCKVQNDKGSEMSQAVGLNVLCEFPEAPFHVLCSEPMLKGSFQQGKATASFDLLPSRWVGWQFPSFVANRDPIFPIPSIVPELPSCDIMSINSPVFSVGSEILGSGRLLSWRV